MMSFCRPFFLSAFLCVATQAVHAQMHFNNCDIVEIVVGQDPYNAHIQLSCVPSPQPPCAMGNPFVAFDKSTAAGRQFLALFIMAQASGRKVSGFVDSSCASFQTNVALLTQLRVQR